jgi:hypothetical protein
VSQCDSFQSVKRGAYSVHGNCIHPRIRVDVCPRVFPLTLSGDKEPYPVVGQVYPVRGQGDAQMIDYRDLLKRYIEHVGQCEGKTYVPQDSGGYSDVKFSPEEEAELDRLYDLVFPPRQGTSPTPVVGIAPSVETP